MGRRRKAWVYGRTARWYEYDQTGRRHHRTKTFGTRDAARRWVRNQNARADLRELGEVVPVPLAEAAREFIAHCEANRLAKDTIVHHGSTLGLLAHVVGSERDVCQVTEQDIEQFALSRLGSSRATVHRHRGSLHRFFAWAVRQGYAAGNPAKAIRVARKGDLRRQRPAITEQQLEQLVGAIDTEDRLIAFWIAVTTGLDRRIIEQLSAAEVDLEARCFRVRRIKTGRSLVPPIHQGLVPWLSSRRSRTPPSRRLLSGLSRQWGETDWWHRVREAAGLPGLLFRDLRALASARLQRIAGLPLADVKEILGHSSVTVTSDHYTAPDPDALARFDTLPLPGLRRLSEWTTERSSASGQPPEPPAEPPASGA
ncbi:MAG: hypothetical protein AMXMBFR13_45860 [Phycisphaerae bacterium]